ncbi:Carboxyvinyl-carboxyphosphonate phosphorylmutase [Nymphaea thermarum]|nr:Carboxyvinyl-carboxyphosphonate phosphorylmutase [Nymphaea thermarum]
MRRRRPNSGFLGVQDSRRPLFVVDLMGEEESSALPFTGLVGEREGESGSAEGIVLMPGCYDALSAAIVQKSSFSAFISGYALSASLLGKPDFGLLTQPEMAEKARFICASAPNIPITADAGSSMANENRQSRQFGSLKSIPTTLAQTWERKAVTGLPRDPSSVAEGAAEEPPTSLGRLRKTLATSAERETTTNGGTERICCEANEQAASDDAYVLDQCEANSLSALVDKGDMSAKGVIPRDAAAASVAREGCPWPSKTNHGRVAQAAVDARASAGGLGRSEVIALTQTELDILEKSLIDPAHPTQHERDYRVQLGRTKELCSGQERSVPEQINRIDVTLKKSGSRTMGPPSQHPHGDSEPAQFGSDWQQGCFSFVTTTQEPGWENGYGDASPNEHSGYSSRANHGFTWAITTVYHNQPKSSGNMKTNSRINQSKTGQTTANGAALPMMDQVLSVCLHGKCLQDMMLLSASETEEDPHTVILEVGRSLNGDLPFFHPSIHDHHFEMKIDKVSRKIYVTTAAKLSVSGYKVRPNHYMRAG